jgi:SAM-dependent methyltransferase
MPADYTNASRRADMPTSSRQFWDAAARKNAAWYVATGYTAETEEFFAQGARETDHFLDFCGIAIAPTDRVLEIGCGVGRMTRRLSELAGSVVATDVSQEMLNRAQANLADRSNIEYVLVPGNGTLPLPDESIDVVFSYITLQHVPSQIDQLRYLHESARVLAPGGRLSVQIRGNTVLAIALDWLGHLRHGLRGRHTLRAEWRGVRLSAGMIASAVAYAAGLKLLPFGLRHRWVIVRTTADLPAT